VISRILFWGFEKKQNIKQSLKIFNIQSIFRRPLGWKQLLQILSWLHSKFLYPTLQMCRVSLEANFGNDPAKPFAYNIEKCPGMGYD
jgi:hypothetical protein